MSNRQEKLDLLRALDLAVLLLSKYEDQGEGCNDSRFASPEFVSLLAVVSGVADDACWKVIDDRIDLETKLGNYP